MKEATKISLWKALENHACSFETSNSAKIYDKKNIFHASACNIDLDYSSQSITPDALELLFSLANAAHLPEKINGLMRGDKLNVSENRPALHTALRASVDTSIWVDGKDVMPEVLQARRSIKSISEQIRTKQIRIHKNG